MTHALILADGRWVGTHGIGRFSKEVLARLQHIEILDKGPSPLSLQNLFWQPYFLHQQKLKYKAYFTPGFNPVRGTKIPTLLTIADLIHLYGPEKNNFFKKIFYETLIKPSLHKSYKIFTVSEYSKKTICEWANISPEKIINVGCGISHNFTRKGAKHTPGYPYLLHVGNTKSHKNIPRLLQAFHAAKTGCKLIFTGKCTKELQLIITKNRMQEQVIFTKPLTEDELAQYYRGALAVVFPSLYEGFGLPLLEAFASGVPVITSNVTSLPEVAGDAALLIDPYEQDHLTFAIEKIVDDETLRQELCQRSLQRLQVFSWDKTAARIQHVLNEVLTM
jgi:glycosyltransferase involved in cell wall biosynthesis